MKTVMKLFVVAGLFVLTSSALPAQHHYGNWIHRNTGDSTFVRCLNDTGSYLGFPPNCFGHGHMYGDSIYCRFEYMPFDSLTVPIDTTFLCWRRLQIGNDSIDFNFMHHHRNRHMMKFDRSIYCTLRWDSSLFHHLRRRWRWTWVRGWNGTAWETLENVSVTDEAMTFTTGTLYSAIAVVGEPPASGVGGTSSANDELSVDVFPNPFGGSAMLRLRTPGYGPLSIRLFDNLGRLVATPVDEIRAAGDHSIPIDGSYLPAGLYFYEVRAGDLTASGRVALIK